MLAAQGQVVRQRDIEPGRRRAAGLRCVFQGQRMHGHALAGRATGAGGQAADGAVVEVVAQLQANGQTLVVFAQAGRYQIERAPKMRPLPVKLRLPAVVGVKPPSTLE